MARLASLRPTSCRAGASAPSGRTVTELRRQAPGTKVIGFPRSAGSSLQRFVKDVPVEAVGGGAAGLGLRRWAV